MLKVSGVSVKYQVTDERCAVSDIGFSLKAGERVALIGANGAGKSTLLLALCGIIEPQSGEISICGTVMEKKTLNDLRKKTGMVFQNPDDQLFMPSVYADITFGPRNYGVPEETIKEKAHIVMRQLGISHLKERLSHKLSSGEKRLAVLAGILIMEPSILLMDEPSSFLDPKARRRLIGILDELPETMLIATHDLDFALDLCSRAVLLKEGRIYSDAPAGEILRDAALLKECGLELPLSLYRSTK